MIEDVPAPVQRIVGMKQVIKAVQSDMQIFCVYIAADADDYVRSKVISACSSCGVDYEITSTMQELGRMCNIDVGAACVAVTEMQHDNPVTV